ncbi:hypothetical protein [Rhodoferax sp.]|uniref:GAF domain-containing protein n=1 Tax=Rhodoferax sp. TaxID=50421 RepID=UPI0026057D5C|nr:hypothetical protein [Rhodoferax sp.]MDD2810194.1 hypothetical protein [Rhodoferax sp.]MDD4943041.1 hypothetical protein [Rhodoferax sp.]
MTKKTFIRAVEYWLPDATGSLLEFGGGFYGDAKRLQASSETLCFGRGEGLPGEAWESGHPVMLTNLQVSLFRRAAAALAHGLTSAVALPSFKGEQLSAVTVLFCGDDQDHAGAIELWHNDPLENVDLTLQDGYYGTTGDTFEFLSRNTSFRAGTGLPGRTWGSQAPVFMPDLGRGSGFLRADSAVKVGINRGFAVPCSSADGANYVLAFLSALATPIARRVDVWAPDALQSHLVHSFGFSEDDGAELAVAQDKLTFEGSLPGQVFGTGTPKLDGQTLLMPVGMQGVVTAVLGLTL